MTTYKPQKGDRIRLTVEGEVTWVNGYENCVVIDGQEYWLRPGVAIEKLPDPEPVWVNGDVIRGVGTNALARVGGLWLEVESHIQIMDHEVSPKWAKGEIEILYKADAENAA